MLTSGNHIVRGEIEAQPRINFYHPNSGNTLTQGDSGYLTIVTVCREDSESIDRCQRSVMNQTNTDYDHILILTEGDPDKDKLTEQCMNLIKGKYVLTLDVDSTLDDTELVEKLRSHNEDIIYYQGSAVVLNGIFQEHFGELDLLVSQKHRLTRSSI